VLRGIFQPDSDEVVGCGRKFHIDECHKLYFSSSIVRIIKSRKVRWVWLCGEMGNGEMWMGGRLILNVTFEKGGW
jgi:hypothetical protein